MENFELWDIYHAAKATCADGCDYEANLVDRAREIGKTRGYKGRDLLRIVNFVSKRLDGEIGNLIG